MVAPGVETVVAMVRQVRLEDVRFRQAPTNTQTLVKGQVIPDQTHAALVAAVDGSVETSVVTETPAAVVPGTSVECRHSHSERNTIVPSMRQEKTKATAMASSAMSSAARYKEEP